MTLDEIGKKNDTDKSSVYHNYLNYYESIFSPFKSLDIEMVEIGVQFGFSIKTWLEYFPKAHIHGVDVANDFRCSDPRYTFWGLDQRNRDQWQHFIDVVRQVDIVIDDGCHNADAHKTTFECLWPILNPGGMYIIEDVYTWWDIYFNSPVSGPDWIRDLIASLNWHGKDYYGKPSPKLPASEFEKSIESITLRRGLAVIRKS